MGSTTWLTGRAAMPRILLLLFVFCSMTMLFIARCGINFDSPPMEPQPPGMRSLESVGSQEGDATGAHRSLHKDREHFREKEKFFRLEISELQQQISSLQSQLQDTRKMADEYAQQPPEQAQYREKLLSYEKHFKAKLGEAELTHGVQMNNEYELVPHCRFTQNRLYLVEPGLGKRVVEKPIGFKKKELMEVVTFSLEQLNRDKSDLDPQFAMDDFLEGIYRTEPAIGTHYELYFRDVDQKSAPTRYRRLVVTRPYGPLQLVSREDMHTRRDVINLILPLAGRVDKFRQFMERFVRICIRIDKRVYLTVVYFGTDGLNDVKTIIGSVSKTNRYKNMKLITLNEEFSRGRGLQVGAQGWTQGDVLLFLCDVDIVFSTDFLERCRLNSKKGSRVYYPIVFSLYNPQVVYSLQDVDIPTENEQLIISKDTGFWRDFGYGMTCQYRSDFLHIKGFDEQIQGWGLEDVFLYRKYVKSDMMVIRATDPGIFHLWHEKYCDPALPSDQYKGCIRSKALNEASHAQLGMLAFKEEIDEHKAIKKKAQPPR